MDTDLMDEKVLIICHQCERRLAAENPRKSHPPLCRIKTRSFRAATTFQDIHRGHGENDAAP